MSVITGLSLFLIATLAVYIVLMLYMRRGWSLIKPYRGSSDPISTKVSILIAARNEQNNIGRTIEAILKQEFPKKLLEIIVVDDHSTDNTASIVQSYADQGVRLLQLNEGDKLNSYKKLAIKRAIDIATGAVIVTTDADCRMGTKWLKTVISCFERTQAYMVSSPVIYSEEKSYFERLQTLEFLYLIGLGAAGIGNGSPTTCNGANLAYRRDVFYEMGGFTGIDNLASGDDELLLHKVAEQYADRIFFCKSLDAAIYTDAKTTLGSFINQRRRWASKSTKYKDKRVVVLGVSFWAFNLAMIVGLTQFLINLPEIHTLFLVALGMKIVAELAFIYPIAGFAGRKELMYQVPILTLVHAFYLVYIGLAGNMGKYDWKGRKVN
ncbi:glycosyltransferase [Sphingobacterium sp. JB170]|uniref:glycosyltransferase n=1 Tax=Sphingobacterium sp. JB170 TaxID=1434842 RepID=UPI000B350785|nr:glycosyltransferase [Sphingobacterium sp. JB170]